MGDHANHAIQGCRLWRRPFQSHLRIRHRARSFLRRVVLWPPVRTGEGRRISEQFALCASQECENAHPDPSRRRRPVDPPGQSQELYRGLKRYGVETELVVYPREPHGFHEEKHLLDRLNRILAWYDKYLKEASPTTK